MRVARVWRRLAIGGAAAMGYIVNKSPVSRPMTTTEFTLNGATLTALPSGGLWWAEERLLCVSDLHLGKSERVARRTGSLIPPYDSRETLHRLAKDVARWSPEQVISLGDNFDDMDAIAGLGMAEHAQLATLKAGRRWVWITGNHDPGPVEVGGTWLDEVRIGPLTFRHIAEPTAEAGEVSGHFHPKHRVNGARTSVTRKAFLHDTTRLILPAYGAYTGGLRSNDPALRSLFASPAFAILTGPKTHRCPI